MKICFIGKFPPIEGGVSRNTYWMAFALAKKGHQVFVVTNADEVERDFRMVLSAADKKNLNVEFPGGGFIKTVSTGAPEFVYIPWTNPFVTKLSSVAADVIRKKKCDLIFSYYLEPYGMAAYLASRWTGVPYVFLHAGSDLGHLIKQPELKTAYVEVLKGARKVLTSERFAKSFQKMGLKKNQLEYGCYSATPTIRFNPRAKKLDVNRYLERSLAENPWLAPSFRSFAKKKFRGDVPTFGMYGKIGDTKGTFDFIEALKILKRKKVKFQALFLVGTWEEYYDLFARHVSDAGLKSNVWLLPFMPHWQVPGFIKSCSAVCFLERDFFINFHTPCVPREVLACGTCLVLSGDIHRTPGYREGLKDGKNFLLVRSPKNHEVLAEKLAWIAKHPERAKTLGKNGYESSQQWEFFDEYVDDMENLFRGFLKSR